MALDIAKAKEALIKERERLVHQLGELGAAETGDLRADYDFGGSFADAAAVTAEREPSTLASSTSICAFAARSLASSMATCACAA